MAKEEDFECFSDVSDEECEVDNVFKVVLIGNSGVGKTNLISKFTKDRFNDDLKPTLGVDFSTKTIRMRKHFIRLQIWDTAGQERYHAFTSVYFKDALGIIVVYDITQKSSFESLGTWLKLIKENVGDESSILLIGNKIDLEEQRKVGLEEGQDFAKEHGMAFYETSALDNRDNCIGKAFTLLLKRMIPKYDFPESNKPEIRPSIRDRIDFKKQIDALKLKEYNNRGGCC